MFEPYNGSGNRTQPQIPSAPVLNFYNYVEIRSLIVQAQAHGDIHGYSEGAPASTGKHDHYVTDSSNLGPGLPDDRVPSTHDLTSSQARIPRTSRDNPDLFYPRLPSSLHQPFLETEHMQSSDHGSQSQSTSESSLSIPFGHLKSIVTVYYECRSSTDATDSSSSPVLVEISTNPIGDTSTIQGEPTLVGKLATVPPIGKNKTTRFIGQFFITFRVCLFLICYLVDQIEWNELAGLNMRRSNGIHHCRLSICAPSS